MKLSIGTAQFGANYGVANKTGKVAIRDIERIIALCRRNGIDTIDTAIAYGDSEKRLGDTGVADFRIVTKLPDYQAGAFTPEYWLQAQVEGSIERLRVPGLYGFLFHHPDQLTSLSGEKLYKSLVTCKEMGLLQKIGVSIYSPDQLDHLMDNFDFDIVQAPFNIVDRRMLESGLFAKLRRKLVEIHIRSVFLQGLLLMEPRERHSYFQGWPELWRTWHKLLSATGMTPLQACLGFVHTVPEIDRIVVGVDSASQLDQIIASIPTGDFEYPESLGLDDKNLVEPSSWPQFD